jgi:hypothetical protein
MFDCEELESYIMAKMVDRQLSLSYKTLLFLKSHGFRLESAFADGVPYLSHIELDILRRDFLVHRGDFTGEPLDITTQDHEIQEFYTDARRQIQNWLDEAREVKQ